MTSAQDTSAIEPSPSEIRAQLDRMAASDVFQSSPQLVSFLRYVIESTLHGKQDRIKAYTIGVEVLRRDPKFDPQLDPIVRVEATRLRRTIERYYQTAGMNDPVMIDLPRGSYIPTFRGAESKHEATALRPIAPPARKRTRAAGAIAALLSLIVIVAAAGFLLRQEPPPQFIASARAIRSFPSLFVQPFEVRGNPRPGIISSGSLAMKIGDALSRFDLIRVVSDPMQEKERVDYRLDGLVEYFDDGRVSVGLRVSDAIDGQIIWTQAFDRGATELNQTTAEEAIVRQFVPGLAQPFGIISAHWQTKYSRNEGSEYECVLSAIDSFRTFDPDQRYRARTCLEQMIERYPNSAHGYTYLAFIHIFDFTYGSVRDEDNQALLDKTLQLSRRGIELNPSNARAYHALSVTYFARRDGAAGFATLDKALALNPYDPVLWIAYGGRLITSGDSEKGLKVLKQYGEKGAILPTYQHFYFFLCNYLTGDLPQATRQAVAMTNDRYNHGLVARALTAAANGEADKAKHELERLVALQSGWRQNPRGELEKFILDASILDRLTKDLAAAGLDQAR